MNALQAYQFQSHQFRVIPDEQGEPLFIAKDVCDILGYTNSRKSVSDHCRKAGVTNRYIPTLSNTYTLIDEGNLYRLIIKSNKPESEPFESWVCDEVLPALRKTGGYTVPSSIPMRDYAELQAKHDSLQDKYITLLEQEVTQLKIQTSIPKPVRRGWSEDEMQEARELKAQDKSAAQIGREIGRSASSVRSFFYYEDSRKGGTV